MYFCARYSWPTFSFNRKRIESKKAAENLSKLVKGHPNLGEDTIKGALETAKAKWQEYKTGDAVTKARILGEVSANVATLVAPLGAAGMEAKLASKSEEAIGLASAGGRVAQAGTAEAKNIAINASSPSEIAWGYGKLSAKQSEILNALPKPGRWSQFHKSYIHPTDLAALTAHTGDEFGLFTLSSRRIIIRGVASGLEIPEELGDKLLSQEWKWSAHTHPGLSDNVLMSSGADRSTLEVFNQECSLILNSAGRRSIFDFEDDYAITNQSVYESTFSPRGY